MSTKKTNMILVDDTSLEQIKLQQKEIIMSQITTVKKNPFWNKSNYIRMALLTLFLVIVSISFILFSNRSTFSIDDFYQNVLLYENRITEIIDENEIELSTLDNFQLKALEEELLTNLRREDILEVYLASENDIVYADYFENLITTQVFMNSIIDVIENEDHIELGVAFYPIDDNPEIMYRFIMSDESDIVIERNEGVDFSYIKMGLDQNLLTYDECHYVYDLEQEELSIANALIYSDFRFIENKEAIYVNSSTTLSTLRYTSIETGTQFTISNGLGIIEGNSTYNDGYVLDYYNAIDDFRVYMQVADSQIISETYDIFNNHGLVYRIDDEVVGDSLYNITTNIVNATGWDYALVSNNSSEAIDGLKGIYTDDGTQLFQGHLNYTLTDSYAYLGIKRELIGEIDESTFSLDSYGLNLEDDSFTYAFYERIHLNSFEEIQDEFIIENLDFFASDLRYQLYHYLDQDIQSSIEGVLEVELASGDTSELLHALDLYSRNLNNTGSLVQVTDSILTLYDKDEIAATIPSRVTISLDMNQMYYHQASEISGVTYQREDIYIQVIDESLIRFDTQDQILEYSLITREPTIEDFLDATNIVSSADPLLGMEKIIARSDYEFTTTVNSRFFSTDADMDVVFQQQGINGLDEASMTLNITFSEDYTSFTQVLLIEGLTVEEYNATYEITTTTLVTTFTQINPLDSTTFFMFLPQSKEDIIITSPTNQQVRYYMNEGQSSWIRVYLEAGDYYTNIYGHMTSLTYEIYDEAGIQITEDYSSHIDESGYYYYKITTPYEQGIEFSVTKITLPTDYYVSLDSTGGHVVIDYIDQYSIYHFTTPIYENPMVMIVNVNKPGVEGEWMILEMEDHMLTYNYNLNRCNFSSTEDTCYFYIPVNSTDLITFNGLYEGEIDFDYEFVDFSYFGIDVTVTDLNDTPALLILPDDYEASVIFTVEESFTSIIAVDIIGIYPSYIDIALYDMEGNLLNSAVNRWSYDFIPGNYKIVIFFSYYNDFPEIGIVQPYFPE